MSLSTIRGLSCFLLVDFQQFIAIHNKFWPDWFRRSEVYCIYLTEKQTEKPNVCIVYIIDTLCAQIIKDWFRMGVVPS